MKICVLQADYSSCNHDYKYYDPPRDLNQWLDGHQVEYIFLHKLTTYKQLAELKSKEFDIFINLCEGYLEWEVPSLDVIYFLELLQLPYTGPTVDLYDPPKQLMKYVAYCNNVLSPQYALIKNVDQLEDNISHLQFPLFVKPAKAGDSLGIDEKSLCTNINELQSKCCSLLDEFSEILVEEYIDGREVTVLVAAGIGESQASIAFQPIEYVFPKKHRFKTYSLKTNELHADANIPFIEEPACSQIKHAAINIFDGFEGYGYARLDFRINKSGRIYFLEINFTCSVFYPLGLEGSADHILKHTPDGHQIFLNQIIAEGIYRHKGKFKLYEIKPIQIMGYGIFARNDIKKDTIVFPGEERSYRLVSKNYVEKHWDEKRKTAFKHYAYPVSQDVYIVWDRNPTDWAPQNHSCEPNTAYNGLNVIAIRNIASGEELTLDYASLIDETAASFECKCGSKNCRKQIYGTRKLFGNSSQGFEN
ncbi:MAG: SET domain-containing protein-lysine N-methyltransferase [Saprospiraceae bacterium]|jgi:D-alanine-D-alanine ligase-like ATP-grasp enzyme|nr:SET domain-containing protein-lysine N-methyltransferase [Saprospiraceae bacterium]MBK7794879.1 SET domain-containing protein-lysine N-methyltransferase [Saprospiraceae bacterium]MBL0261290.1 SET domain-containing protein-lysine N-methyltransferase [Saprospiraceae bacterium]